jgi:hypothetical protein
MSAALDRLTCDLVIADPCLPALGIHTALAILMDKGIDVPFIVLLDIMDEATAQDLMKLSAHDYILRNQLKRLVPAVERRLHEAKGRRERLMQELQDARQRLQMLSSDIMEVQEAERRRIALERHDVIGQDLTRDQDPCRGDPAPARRFAGGSANGKLFSHRGPCNPRRPQSLHQLRPSQLDDLGLVAALRSLVAQQAPLCRMDHPFPCRFIVSSLGPAP